MYGGHITDDWDRRLCVSYLEELMQPELVDGELQLAPGNKFLVRVRAFLSIVLLVIGKQLTI